MMSIWTNKKPFTIAEIGGNHEGDFEYAKKLTVLACQSKADSIKYQIYTGDTLVSPVENPTRNAHFKKFELSKEQYIELAKICKSYNKDFAVSVWDTNALEWIDPYLTYYKIGSGDFNCLPIIDQFIKRKKPIIISTGLATEDEVLEVIKYVKSKDSFYAQKDNLAVLQCNSMYPSPDEDINLRTIPRYRELLNINVGYSDHSIGTTAALGAVALGAEIIEVHFTDTRENKKFRDHLISFTKDELNTFITEAQRMHEMLGSSIKKVTKSEQEAGHPTSFRRAVYLSHDLKKGDIVTENNVCFLRPCHGLEAKKWHKILGMRAKNDLNKYTKLKLEDFE